jgi:hypothetical protein
MAGVAPTGFQVVAGCRKFPCLGVNGGPGGAFLGVDPGGELPAGSVELYFADHTSANNIRKAAIPERTPPWMIRVA